MSPSSSHQDPNPSSILVQQLVLIDQLSLLVELPNFASEEQSKTTNETAKAEVGWIAAEPPGYARWTRGEIMQQIHALLEMLEPWRFRAAPRIWGRF